MDCIFSKNVHIKCKKDLDPVLSNITFGGLDNVIQCSIKREDNLHLSLSVPDNVNARSISTYKCHKNCKSTYTSEDHIRRQLDLNSTKSVNEEVSLRSPLRSQVRSSSFVWKEHCLFCAEKCSVTPDPRHPDRWRESYECHTSKRENQNTFKDVVLDACDKRNDEWSDDVRTRLSDRRCSYDLHSADGRYHDDCRKRFMNVKKKRLSDSSEKKKEDEAFKRTVGIVQDDTSRMWTSIELEALYKEQGGSMLSRPKLAQNIRKYFGNKMVVLSSPGLANILIFRTHASSIMRLQEDVDEAENSTDEKLDFIAKTIVEEIKAIPYDKSVYRKRINMDIASEDTSPTLCNLLSRLSPNLKENTLPCIYIGNIVTSKVVRRSTHLLVDLSILIREKRLVKAFYEYGAVASYDELSLFRSSAAVDGNKSSTTIMKSDKLEQVVGDNFDCNISSPNGLKQTHSLAMIVTQQDSGKDPLINETFPRLKVSSLKDSALKDVPVIQYYGPKKTDMPQDEAKRKILPLKVLAHQVLIVERSKEIDFKFFNEIISDSPTPEFSGFNNRMTRKDGRSLMDPTVCMYTPLIDLKPSDPTTMLTAAVEAMRLSEERGQQYTIFTADQQLYKVLCDIKWADPKRFEYFIPRLGGMHFLMSFVGCVGILMQNSGLADIMKSAFAGVPKMLSGKNFPNNVRALRIVVEELLRGILVDIESESDLQTFLSELAAKSKTSQLWIDGLIKPVFLMMLYVRAEREAEWPLHLYAVSEMIPYFFAAGHPNYARYGLYYLRSMERLPPEVLKHFLKGEHVMRHQGGYWNGIWSDMYIETTFMKYGKGPGGLIGLTLNPNAVKKWANGLHICTQILKDLDDMHGKGSSKDKIYHKEEMRSRIEYDSRDRSKIRKALENCISPLDPDQHPDHLVNVYSGIIATDSVNVHNSVSIGTTQMKEFEEKWPGGFYESIKRCVKTMVVNKKSVKIQDVEVYNTEAIYARVMALISTGMIKLEEVLKHELSPIPVSLFEETGEMRAAKNKSDLKKCLQVVESRRLQTTTPDAIVIDGSALLWTVHWPTTGTVEDLAKAVLNYINKHLQQSDVYLIFDRYFEFSPKGCTRSERAHNIKHRHKFNLNTPLPNQTVALTSSTNKVQLIDLISGYLLDTIPKELHERKLVITGSEETPYEVNRSNITKRDDLSTTHEEGDIIIIQQVFCAAQNGAKTIKVICDDTDVFVLLSHYLDLHKLNATILMEATHNDRTLININKSVSLHQDILSSILPMHALTGCDTVPKLFGIGKRTGFKVLKKKNFSFQHLGKIEADLENVFAEATGFIGACYGVKNQTDMSEIRYIIWRKRIEAGKLSSTPKLCGLPPTTEVFLQNVLRAHYQAIIWLHSLSPNPPSLDPCKFGWYKDNLNKLLLPIMLPADCNAVPPEVLKIFCCKCSSSEPCLSTNCSCCGNKLSCSIFCACYGDSCYNKWTVSDVGEDEENEEEEDNDNNEEEDEEE